MKKVIISILIITSSVLIAQSLFSHCEVPCGIYNDKMRCDMIEEHITTIEKAMTMIVKISNEDTINYNQLVRWINNKEKHATEIQHIVSQYFMTQRVKPVTEQDTEEYKKYIKKLTFLHEMIIYAMKAKQSTELDNVKKLGSLLSKFRNVYFASESPKHKH